MPTSKFTQPLPNPTLKDAALGGVDISPEMKLAYEAYEAKYLASSLPSRKMGEWRVAFRNRIQPRIVETASRLANSAEIGAQAVFAVLHRAAGSTTEEFKKGYAAGRLDLGSAVNNARAQSGVEPGLARSALDHILGVQSSASDQSVVMRGPASPHAIEEFSVDGEALMPGEVIPR